MPGAIEILILEFKTGGENQRGIVVLHFPRRRVKFAVRCEGREFRLAVAVDIGGVDIPRFVFVAEAERYGVHILVESITRIGAGSENLDIVVVSVVLHVGSPVVVTGTEAELGSHAVFNTEAYHRRAFEIVGNIVVEIVVGLKRADISVGVEARSLCLHRPVGVVFIVDADNGLRADYGCRAKHQLPRRVETPGTESVFCILAS